MSYLIAANWIVEKEIEETNIVETENCKKASKINETTRGIGEQQYVGMNRFKGILLSFPNDINLVIVN